MKKSIYIFIVLITTILITAGCAKKDSNNFGYSYIQNESVTGSVLTTSTAPTLVVPRNTGRRYVSICNNSGEEVFLWLDNFASARKASTTISRLGGIQLGASSTASACYEISENKFIWPGDIWSSTSSQRDRIIYLEK